MKFRHLILAGALATGMAAFAPAPAEARGVSVHIGIGAPHYYYGYPRSYQRKRYYHRGYKHRSYRGYKHRRYWHPYHGSKNWKHHRRHRGGIHFYIR
jgi:hypothetical protein